MLAGSSVFVSRIFLADVVSGSLGSENESSLLSLCLQGPSWGMGPFSHFVKLPESWRGEKGFATENLKYLSVREADGWVGFTWLMALAIVGEEV